MSNIEITTHYDEVNHLIITKPIGTVTNENIKATVYKALELSKLHSCPFLFFDITQCPEGQSMMEGFALMSGLKDNTGLSFQHKLAIYYDPSIYPEDRARFIETVVANRPNPAFRVFSVYEEALNWLRL